MSFFYFFLLLFSLIFKNFYLMVLILTFEFMSLVTIFFSLQSFFSMNFFIYTFIVLILLSLESIFLLVMFVYSNQFFSKDYMNFFLYF